MPRPVSDLLRGAAKQMTGSFNHDVRVLQVTFNQILHMSEPSSGNHNQAGDLSSLPILKQAFDRNGTRLIQERLLRGDKTVEAALLQQLAGHGVEFMKDIAAHRVAEVIAEHLPSQALAELLLSEIEGSAIDLALDKFGCRVLCRAIRFCGGCKLHKRVIEELLCHIPLMRSHEMGSPVLEAILEVGHEPWCKAIFQVVKGNLRSLSKDKCGSHVVERVVRHCEADREAIVKELLADTAWVKTPGGRHVAKVLMEVRPAVTSFLTGAKSQQQVAARKQVESAMASGLDGKSRERRCLTSEERRSMNDEMWLKWLGPAPSVSPPHAPSEEMASR